MVIQDKTKGWVYAPTPKPWEFLTVPNFKSLAVLSTVGLLAFGSTQAFAADAYQYGSPAFASSRPTENQNPNEESTLDAPTRAFIKDNARIEDSRAVVPFDPVAENVPPMEDRPGYFKKDGGSELTVGKGRQ